MARKCNICENNIDLGYNLIEPETLKGYTRQNLIEPRARTKLCEKHQRKVAKAIKRLRHMHLMPH